MARSISPKVIEWLQQNGVRSSKSGLTPFAQAMPDEYKNANDPVLAYRNYYLGEKRSFATWKEPSKQPDWWE